MNVNNMTPEFWSTVVRGSREAWDAATSTREGAESALAWITETRQSVQQQLAAARPAGRLPDAEYAEYLDWKASGLGFMRHIDARARELKARIKEWNIAESEAERAAYLQQRAVLDALAESGVRAVLDQAARALHVALAWADGTATGTAEERAAELAGCRMVLASIATPDPAGV